MHTGGMAIEFDPAKAAQNLRKHRVSFSDAEQVLHDERALTIEDPDAEGEPRFITLGMDALGPTPGGCPYTARSQHQVELSAPS